MKKFYPVYTIFFALFAFLSNLHAQEDGEWLWAKAYSGHGNPQYAPQYSNSIVKSAFDEEGNVYILGTFMIGAEIEGDDIYPFPGSIAHPGQIIAKFDIEGNLIWKKIIKYAAACYPKGIQIRGNKVYVLADVEMRGNGLNVSTLYYLDTLVRYQDIVGIPLDQCTPPFGVYGGMNAFITFDLDGNVLRQSFLQCDDRVPDPWVPIPTAMPIRSPLAFNPNLPFYVDRNENIYMLGKLEINGSDPSEPLYTVINGAHKDAFYMPDTVPYGVWSLSRWVLYKFTPNFDLLWVKPFIYRTEGIPPFPGYNDDINARYFDIIFHGISGDEENNLYISGDICTTLSTADALLCAYPVHYYFDNSHYGVVYTDHSSWSMPFLIKYDTDGNVLWNQQLHYKITSNLHRSDNTFFGNILDESFVYVTSGISDINAHLGDTIFIDAAMTIPIIRPNSGQYMRGFFVRYDKETGDYQSHGIVPAEQESPVGTQPAVINNHVLLQSAYAALYVEGKRGIDYFRDDGKYMGRDNISCAPASGATISEVIVHPSGHLFTHFTGRTNATFGGITVETGMGDNPAAFFAMMHKPSLLIPYAYKTYNISGQVTLDGNPMAGVTINYGSNSVITAVDGIYRIDVNQNATVTLIPSLTGYTFTPGYITCDNVTADLFNQNFVAVADTVGIVSTTLNNRLQVYPNPTTGELTITYPPLAGAGGGIISDVEIFDIYGRKLNNCQLSIINYQLKLSISHLPSGVYILRVDGQMVKVVKE